LIAKAIRDFSTEKILVVCYTHHALDQFLEELLDLGIPTSDIVRLGNAKKATQRTSPLSLWESGSRHKFMANQVWLLNKAREAIKDAATSLVAAFTRFQQTNLSKADVLEHLEFRSEGPQFYAAFEVPTEEGEMTRVGASGRKVDGFYLFDRWRRGKDAGVLKKAVGRKFSSIWNMRSDERIAAYNQWRSEILEAISSHVRESGEAYDRALLQVRAVYMEKDLEVIRQKRIIACTTTGAAKYVKQVQSVAPGVVLVEEAGEILESHILTALSPETKQLILIGDHKQLRPKVNNYRLSVEKGDGYDLNRSLFERLVLKGFPHQVLSQQHRMRPELSAVIRKLTYPELSDAPKTYGRPNLRGFTANMIFVDHRQPEVDISEAREWRDGFSPSSKKNAFEGEMTLKCVRYLGQQGYGTADIVILTPYLGQLRLLVDQLSKTTDPVLSDLDSYDLVRAGLMPDVPANIGKPKIRISTIGEFKSYIYRPDCYFLGVLCIDTG
jgi:AAA domain